MQTMRRQGAVLLLAGSIAGIAAEYWVNRGWTHYSLTFALLALIAAINLALWSSQRRYVQVAVVLAMSAVFFGDLFYRRLALHDMRGSDFIGHFVVYSFFLGLYLVRVRSPRP
jgi:hypothetical protein